MISEEELDKIKKTQGKATGDCIKNDLDFVLKKEGKEGLRRVEDAMAKLGYPINYKKLGLTDIYPAAFPVALIIIIKRLFNYDENDLEKMGRMEARISSRMIRTFLKYFISLDLLANNAQRMWRAHYKMGDFKVTGYDVKKRYVCFRIENFKTHVYTCQVLKGYFAGFLEMIVGKKTTAEETKCVHRGDEYHEFLIRW